jgi:predicted RNA binding protein YcfA (HicA-like mRNA interferase family)
MTSLPVVKPKAIIKALEKAGLMVIRQKGSHVQMHHPRRAGVVTVPNHPGVDIKKGTLKGLLEQAGLSFEEFLSLL